MLNDIGLRIATKAIMAGFDPNVNPDAPAGMKSGFAKLMGFIQYTGLAVMVAALIGAGISFGMTHNREDASESVAKLVKPLIGVAIISAAVGIISFVIK